MRHPPRTGRPPGQGAMCNRPGVDEASMRIGVRQSRPLLSAIVVERFGELIAAYHLTNSEYEVSTIRVSGWVKAQLRRQVDFESLTIGASCKARNNGFGLFHRNRLRQIPWLVHVAAAAHGDVVGEQ